MLRQDPGASLSDLPHARLAAQTNHACLAAIETMAERYSGRRVMLGEAAFVDSSDLVLDQTFLRGPDGQILDGRRGKPRAAAWPWCRRSPPLCCPFLPRRPCASAAACRLPGSNPGMTQ